MPSARAAFCCVALLCLAAPARALDTWSLDPVHTRVMFAIGHAGFSKAIGTVSGSTGTLHFEPGRWQDARIEVQVPMTRVDLGDARWNEATLAPRLLDAARHPSARFVSHRVDPVDEARARVCGDLTLRGITRPLCLDVTLNAVKRHPLPPFRRTAGFSATGTLSRAEFGIDAWPSMIGDQVDLRIEAEAVRSRSAAPGTSPAPASADPSSTGPSMIEPTNSGHAP